ncbi:MAG: hypothetical protein LDLANPLL_00063 [Turneriella sp.]|nr:hypothetical protein [Turneriella sp.]
MERVVGKFKSHTEAAEADKNFMGDLPSFSRDVREFIALPTPNNSFHSE